MSWKEHLEKAIAEGYDPKKEKSVTEQRDNLLSAKVKAERELAEVTAKFNDSQGLLTGLKDSNKKLTADLETATAQASEYEAHKDELQAFQAQQADQTKQDETKIKEITANWKKASPDTIEAIPQGKTPKETLAWLDKYSKNFFTVSDEDSTDNNSNENNEMSKQTTTGKTGKPATSGQVSKKVQEYANNAGMSLEAAQKWISKREKAKD